MHRKHHYSNSIYICLSYKTAGNWNWNLDGIRGSR